MWEISFTIKSFVVGIKLKKFFFFCRFNAVSKYKGVQTQGMKELNRAEEGYKA